MQAAISRIEAPTRCHPRPRFHGIALVLLLAAAACGDPPEPPSSSGDPKVVKALEELSKSVDIVPSASVLEPTERGKFSVDVENPEQITVVLPIPPANVDTQIAFPVDLEVLSWSVRGQSPDNYDVEILDPRQAGIFLLPDFVAPNTPQSQREATGKRTIVARIKLKVDGDKATPKVPGLSAYYEFSESIDITQAAVPVPRVVVMTSERNFGSPIDTGAMILFQADGRTTCGTIQESFSQISGIAGELHATLPNAGLNPLTIATTFAHAVVEHNTQCLTQHAFCRTPCAAEMAIGDLYPYTLREPNPLFNINRLSAEDSIDSVLLLGPSGTTVHFFVSRGHDDGTFNDDDGHFTLTTGPVPAVTVRNLKASGSPPTVGADPSSNFVEVISAGQEGFANLLSAVAFGEVTVDPD